MSPWEVPLLRHQEARQRVREVVRRFFSHVMPRIDAVPPHVQGPVPPDRERVAVEVFEVVAQRPQDQERATNPVAGGSVCFLMLSIDGGASAVILQHASHHKRVPRGFSPLVVILLPHARGVAPIPTVGVGVDDPLRCLRLSEEEPVPPAGRELRVRTGEVFADRDAVQQRETRHQVAVIQGEAEGDVASPVMTGESELFVPCPSKRMSLTMSPAAARFECAE